MDIRKLVGMGILAGALGLAGCGDDDGGSDAGGGGTDGGGTDAGPMDPDLPLAQVGDDISPDDPQAIDPATAMPADFSCVGSVTAPADDGAEISFTLTMEDFQEGNPVPDVCVEFYPDNTLDTDDTCDGMTTDEEGNITVMDNAGSWYAYRVFPHTGPTPATTVVGSVQYNEASPDSDGGDATGNSVSQATINLIPTVLGFRRAEGTAVLAGTLSDCNDDPVYGTIIRVYSPDGTLIAEGRRQSEPHFRYFDGDDFPNGSQPWSHRDGLYAAANLPVSDMPVFVELWGRTAEGAPLELLGCETARLFADTVTILNVGPKRSDGPTCPGEM